MNEIILYTKQDCPYCVRAKLMLTGKGASFQEIDIETDVSARQEMTQRSGRLTVPQIFIGHNHVGGFDDLAALDAQGQLDSLLSVSPKTQKSLRHHKVIIIGSGPAGYTAAIYAARAGLEPLLVSGLEVGGQLVSTHEIENWPGGDVDLQGPLLMDNMQDHALRMGVEITNDVINAVDFADRPLKLSGEINDYAADTVIIATGAKARTLGLPGEETLRGNGLSSCATCDGFFFKDKAVAVIGGGSAAVEEALYLSKIAQHVTLIHRRDELRAEKVLQDRLFELERSGRISLIWNSRVEAFLSESEINRVSGLRLANVETGETRDLRVEGAFVAIGHDPNTALFKDWLQMDHGYILTEDSSDGKATATSVPGVFAAGDVADAIYRQAITSAASGAMAALDAERYLNTV